ncbi:MAG: DNA primase [Anaerolineae bacterium]|nr:DNA primase [Anaerolineae bacterium]
MSGVVDEIKARIDIVDLVTESVKLRKSGKSYTGFCPFHSNSRTPAFAVFPDSGTWRCFGQCNEGGDIFKFVMKKEGWDFAQALQYLAQRAGVELEAQTPEKEAEDQQEAHLRTLLEDAVIFYRHQLMQTPAGQPALEYLQKRGLTPETMETFGLGYAPGGWEALTSYFLGKGYSPKDLLEAGMASERQSGEGIHDRFRNRIMFPIRDAMGRMAGFGGRILDPNDVPKFLNSPQTPLFDKGRLLYGLDAARKAIRAADQAVIVEGYLDVIVLHQCGFNNAVSPMGTALTEDQLRNLKKLTRRLVLALDADAAGQKATLRGLEIAREAMDHSAEAAFDARGLLRYETRLQADLRVTTIPDGMDPDEVALRDPQEWRTIVEAAQPIVLHVLNTLISGRNIDDPKVKSEIVAQVLPLIEDVPDVVEREDLRQRLARALRLDERALTGVSSVPRGSRPPRGSRGTEGRSSRPAIASASAMSAAHDALPRSLEAHCLSLLVYQPDLLYSMDRVLQNMGLSRVTPADYEYTDHQLIMRLVNQALEQDELEPAQFIRENIPLDLKDLVESINVSYAELTQEKILEDLYRTLLMLRQIRVKEGLSQMHLIQRDLQDQPDIDQTPYLQLVTQYTQTLFKINKALGQAVLQLD